MNDTPETPKPRKKKDTQLAVVDRGPITPMSLIQIGLEQNVDIDKLEKLMDLHFRWEANEAQKAFTVAMNAFKSDVPEILKNQHVSYTNKSGTVTDYDHATLDAVCDALIPALSKYQLSHRWKVEQINGRVRVTCVITHEKGHSEETSMEGPPDDSGGKNAIQAISSSTTYLERYTFLAATGTAAKGTDNDGQGAPKMEGFAALLESIKTAPNLKTLDTTFKAAFKQAIDKGDPAAMKALVWAKDERKAALQAEEPA